jgi:LysR family transcriptional regulator, low CO2-responsive transcriptional regulator
MRSFHAVAMAGSFTGAARMLHVSQPPVTKHVKELETLYGVELFHRHSRGAELTDVGRRLLAIVQRVVANQEDAVDYLREVSNLRTGHVRVGTVNPFQVADILALFSARYPKVTVSVGSGNSRALVEDLRNYRIDVGVVGQIGPLQDIEAITYSRPEIVIIVNRRHAWAKRRDIAIADLRGQPMVLREAGSETRRLLEEAASRSGIPLTSMAEFSGREGLVAAVAHGVGVGAVSDDHFFEHSLLRKLRVRDADLRTDVLVACLKERRDSRIIRAFMECAVERAKGRRDRTVRRKA